MNKLSSFIINISQSKSRFLKKETAVTIKEFSSHDMDAASSIPFVDLIICPEYFAAYKKEALSYFGLDKEGYKRGGTYYPSKNWLVPTRHQYCLQRCSAQTLPYIVKTLIHE